MKKLILATVIVATTPMVADAQSLLSVSLTDQAPITVSVDGRYFNKRGQTVTVGDLPQGRHWLKIYCYNRDRDGDTYGVVVYEGKVRTMRGQETVFTYDRYNGTTVSSVQPMNYGSQGYESYNNKNLNNYDDRSTQYQNQPGYDNYNNNSYTNNTPDNQQVEAPAPLPEGTPLASPVSQEPEVKVPKGTAVTTVVLDNLKKKADAKSNDTEKITVVKNGLNKSKLTSAQVAKIMGWFNFESTKEEFAEWAYTRTTDKDKYATTVRAKLTRKNYLDDFDTFLNSQR